MPRRRKSKKVEMMLGCLSGNHVQEQEQEEEEESGRIDTSKRFGWCD
jgi:hypothetical protein